MGEVFRNQATYEVEIADGRVVNITVDLERGNVRVEGAPHVDVAVPVSKLLYSFIAERSDMESVAARDRFVVAVSVMPGKIDASLYRIIGPWWFEEDAPRLTVHISPPTIVHVWASVHDVKGNEQVVRGTRPLVEEPAGVRPS